MLFFLLLSFPFISLTPVSDCDQKGLGFPLRNRSARASVITQAGRKMTKPINLQASGHQPIASWNQGGASLHVFNQVVTHKKWHWSLLETRGWTALDISSDHRKPCCCRRSQLTKLPSLTRAHTYLFPGNKSVANEPFVFKYLFVQQLLLW